MGGLVKVIAGGRLLGDAHARERYVAVVSLRRLHISLRRLQRAVVSSEMHTHQNALAVAVGARARAYMAQPASMTASEYDVQGVSSASQPVGRSCME